MYLLYFRCKKSPNHLINKPWCLGAPSMTIINRNMDMYESISFVMTLLINDKIWFSVNKQQVTSWIRRWLVILTNYFKHHTVIDKQQYPVRRFWPTTSFLNTNLTSDCLWRLVCICLSIVCQDSIRFYIQSVYNLAILICPCFDLDWLY